MKKILITCIVIITLAACISPTMKHQIPAPEKPVTKKSQTPETTPPSKTPPKPVSLSNPPILRIDPGGHTSLISDIIVTSDQQHLISASDDKTIRVWNLKTGKEERKILGQIGSGNFGKIYAIALSPDQTQLAVGGFLADNPTDGSAIRIYDYPTDKLRRTLKSHSDVVFDLSFSPDGNYLVSGSSDFTVKVWHATNDYALIHTFQEHTNDVYAVRIFPIMAPHSTAISDYRIVSGALDNQVILYSLNQKKAIARYEHKDIVDSLAVSNTYIASAGDDKKIQLFDHDLKPVKTISSETIPTGLAFSPDHRLLLSGTGDSPYHCNLYDTHQNFKCIQTFTAHDNLVRAVTFLDHQTAITAGGANIDIDVWSTQTGQIKAQLTGQGKSIWAVGITQDAQSVKLAFGNTSDYNNQNNRGPLERVMTLSTFQVTDLPTDSDFQRISTLYQDIRLSHTSGGDYGYYDAVLLIKQEGLSSIQIVRDSTNGYRHRTYGFTPNGTIISGGSNGFLTAYHRDGTHMAEFKGHTGVVWSIAIAGKWMVSGGDDQVLMLWDLTELTQGKTDIRPVLRVFVDRHNEWVAWIEEGYFDASSKGAEYVGYHINHGKDQAADYVRIGQMYDIFARRDLVIKKLSHDPDAPMLIQNELARTGTIEQILSSGMAPEISWMDHLNTHYAQTNVPIKLKIKDQGGGIGKVVIKINGVEQAAPATRTAYGIGKDDPTEGEALVDFDVSLPDGDNDVSIAVYNQNGTIMSQTQTQKIHVDDPMKDLPDLYALVIGISKYHENDIQLKFAASDAQEVAKILANRGKPLFKRIHIQTLLDQQAQIPAIKTAFADLAKHVTVGDVFMLYLAGHGTIIEGDYHFIPWEMKYTSPQALKSGSISRSQFQDLLKQIKAQKSMIIIDTCHSGAFSSNESTAFAMRGMAEKSAIRRFKHFTGRAIFAAAAKDQKAPEGYNNHGVFTYALLEAMKEKADLFGNKDGFISVDEVVKYVTKRVTEISEKEWQIHQYPYSDLTGSPYFDIGCQKGYDQPGCQP
ncbi:secreted protein containing Peptidase C14, caspase catalytic domain protein [Candidatus Magnetomorum sp. HK-1]|nr:secreted protein containing Peptidase C14, caspase catalytic domain protein [Candidatus Magnetomorum sp. HK-1]